MVLEPTSAYPRGEYYREIEDFICCKNNGYVMLSVHRIIGYSIQSSKQKTTR